MAGATPTKYIQIFQNYDHAFIKKCHTIKNYTQDASGHDTSYPLPCVFATPDRAFGQIRRQIARKKKIKEEDVDIRTIPLPIASISRLGQSIDLSRYVRHKFNRLYYNPSEDKYIGMDRPNPWDLTYQVDIWAKTIGDLDSLTTQMNLWLRADEFYLTVDHPIPMGERIVLTQFKGMVDNSLLDSKTEEKRSLRRSFTFIVHGWIVHPAQNADVIRKVISDVYDDYDETIDPIFLERIVVTSSGGEVDDLPVEPKPEDETMGSIKTTLFGLLIPGEVEADENYGNFIVPASASITGMSVAILGRASVGSDLKLQLTIDDVVDSTRHIVVPAGQRKKAVIFGDALSVVAGNVLGVHCVEVGDEEPGDWLEIRFNTTLTVSI